MVYKNLSDFLKDYNNLKSHANERYGFELKGDDKHTKYHIHCYSFNFKDDIVDLLDKDKNIIVSIMQSKIYQITFCKANYTDILSTAWLEGFSW